MKTTVQNIGLYGIGTEFCIHLDNIGNDGDENIHDVVINVKIPDGVKYSRSNLQQGSFDAKREWWDVGTLLKHTDIVGTLCFVVEDDTKGPFTFTFDITTANNCKGCSEDATFCVIAEGVSGHSVTQVAGSNFYSTTEVATGATDMNGDMIYTRSFLFAGQVAAPQVLAGLIPDDVRRILKVEPSWRVPGPPQQWMTGPVTINENAAGTDQPFEVDTIPAGGTFTDLLITIHYTKIV